MRDSPSSAQLPSPTPWLNISLHTPPCPHRTRGPAKPLELPFIVALCPLLLQPPRHPCACHSAEVSRPPRGLIRYKCKLVGHGLCLSEGARIY